MTTEWFRTAFGEEYLTLYEHRDDDEARRTVELIGRATGLRAGAHVLDAPCGAGRHARVFAAHGYATVGLDLSGELLARARSAGPAAPGDVPHNPVYLRAGPAAPGDAPHNPVYLRADLRALPLADSSFDLVVNLFSSFGYFDSDDENYGVLREMARACRPGGFLLLDFFNEAWVRTHLQPQTCRTTRTGSVVTERRRIAGAPPRVEKRTEVRHPDGTAGTFTESVRLFTRDELAAMMERAGVPVRESYGDYTGAPIDPHRSPRIILLGRKTARQPLTPDHESVRTDK